MHIAMISSKGGTGKTTAAVALASYWAHQTSVLLADCDPQDTGSATWWLNRTDQRLTNLSWVKTTAQEIAEALPSINANIVIVDTRPSVQDQHLINLARNVDLVVIPGSAYESGTITQTAKTIADACPTPCVAVLTKTSTQTADSAITQEMNHGLQTIGCPVIGRIRRYVAMEAAATQGRRPGQLPGQAGTSIQHDVNQLAHAITQRIENS